MRKAWAILLALLLLVSCAACSCSDESTMPPVTSSSVVVTPEAQIPTNVEPSIRGFITRINYSVESTEILVEYYPDSEPEYNFDKALVKLDSNTAVATDKGDTVHLSALTVGAVVEVWFTEPSAESYPVLAYGQAVRVVTTSNNISGVAALPQLHVTSGSSSIAVVTKAEWRNITHTFAPLRNLLEQTTGAHISVAPGDTITLNFSREPSSVTVAYSTSTLSAGKELPISGDMNKIIIPEDATGEIYVRVNAEWSSGTVQYAFAVVLIEPAQQ